MENRRQFIKNGLLLCLGTGGILLSETACRVPDSGGRSWGMVIDQSRCSGCQSCMIACKLQNNTAPEAFNTKITEEEKGSYPNAKITFTAGLCHHCINAPCVSVCPTGAAYVHESGLVMTDWNKCDGNGACVEACPYDARFHDDRFGGKTDKCDLCINRVSQGLKPACVENCPTGARIFGRLDKPEGEFAAYLKKTPARQLKSGSVFIISSVSSEVAP